MKISVSHAWTPGVPTYLPFTVGYEYGKSELISFAAQTPAEEHALREMAVALERVLPANSIFLDIDPVMKPDGHGDHEPTGDFRVGIRIFAKPGRAR